MTLEDFLAGFQHRFHELVERCLQSASYFFHLAFCGFPFPSLFPHFGMSLFHNVHVLMHSSGSFPVGLTI